MLLYPPPEIERIPSKISTGFSGFTADQWKNWVCYYSAFALKRILPREHYDAWMCFVTACRLIGCQSVHKNGTMFRGRIKDHRVL